ncbi:MAG: fasciclin domain-containing protein, partial [Candidatus Poseidoniaceae archaeon]|nr:fasciclin domain-containing protein [Candidatus Poseidoniaceae archaeon]
MKKPLVYLTFALLIASTLPISATADANDDIPTNAAATGVHDSLVAALTHANLVTTLQGTGPFTVFAPTDQAFTDAGIDLNDFDTPEENATLSDILLYHVVSGSVPSSAVTDGMLATMVNGDKVKFGVSGGTVTVGTANVTTADVPASNGIIHVIDKVLMPPVDIPATAQTTGIHNSLVAAVIQADLLPTLQGEGPFTLFAPTDQAFADAGIDLAALNTPEGKATLTDILLYHVYIGTISPTEITQGMQLRMANGDNTTFSLMDADVNGANITIPSVMTSNGIIHVIDQVLIPPVEGDENTDGDATESSEDDETSWLTYVLVITGVIILGVAAGLLYTRKQESSGVSEPKEYGQGGIINQLQPIDASSYASPQTTTQSYDTGYAQQAVAQPVQPVVA